mmetsp:Transcript_135533/g.421060  ORF Transcript_135533/g.421060 Transcript_135533/m.421060 type:complete len:240 (+) Transcript_135533:141-860(+)
MEVKVEGIPNLAHVRLGHPSRRARQQARDYVDLGTRRAVRGYDEVESVQHPQEHVVVLLELVSLPQVSSQQLVLELPALAEPPRGSDPALHHARAVQDVGHRVCEPLSVQHDVLAQALLVEEDNHPEVVEAPQTRGELLLTLDPNLSAHVEDLRQRQHEHRRQRQHAVLAGRTVSAISSSSRNLTQGSGSSWPKAPSGARAPAASWSMQRRNACRPGSTAACELSTGKKHSPPAVLMTT